MSESYVIQGLTAAGTFLVGLFAIFKYVINKITILTDDSHKTIQTLSERHTASLSALTKDSIKSTEQSVITGEKLARSVDSLNTTLLSQMLNIPTKSDLATLIEHFDNKHDSIENKLDIIIKK